MTDAKGPTLDLDDLIDEEVGARNLSLGDKLAMLLVAAVMGLIANWAATGATPVEALPGMAILFAASVVGVLLAQLVPLKLPAVAWVSLLAILITLPGMPGSATVVEEVGKLNFLALATPGLAYGGLALTRTEFDIARTSGWKIVIVAICVMLGTYMGSVVIADLSLRFL
jgi:hypothetical protein